MGEGILNNTFSECPQVTNFAGSLCLKLNLEQQKLSFTSWELISGELAC